MVQGEKGRGGGWGAGLRNNEECGKLGIVLSSSHSNRILYQRKSKLITSQQLYRFFNSMFNGREGESEIKERDRERQRKIDREKDT